MEEKRNAQMLVGLRERDHSGNLGVDGRLTLVLRNKLPDVDCIYANEVSGQWLCL